MARYVFMPGVIPRIRDFARSGFGWLAYLMAYLYASVRLLPPNHPYLQHENFGRFGLRHVVVEAANRLVMKRENIDQIVVFFVLALGFALLVIQFLVLVMGIAFPPAHAAFVGFFQTPNPANDIAYELLDKVFAIPNLYGSQYDPAATGISPFSAGLHQLIEFYNFAILLVAVLIFLYYMVVVVAETATTGTPFGRRFSHVYAPLRLVIAVGLLVPLNYGLNGAQYITLFAAKFGSSLATNTWIVFNQALADSMGGNANPLGLPHETLIARPQPPDTSTLIQFMSIAKTCAQGYKVAYTTPPYAVANTVENTNIQPYLVWGTMDSAPLIGTTYANAIGPTMFNGKDIVIRFGHKSAALYANQRGYVYPFCGEVTVHVGDVTQTGSRMMQEQYYNAVRDLWNNAALQQFAERMTAIHLSADPNRGAPQTVQVDGDANPNNGKPIEAFKQARVDELNELVQTALYQARDQMAADTDFGMPPEVLNRGWAGAAIWYNRIAMWNGALFSAVFNTPTPTTMPSAMESTERERRIHNVSADKASRYEPYMQEGRPVGIERGEESIVRMLSDVYDYWVADTSTSDTDTRPSGAVFMDMINFIFPIKSLYQVRDNIDVHPLAQLVAMGKSILDSAMRNLLIGLAFAAGGGFMSVYAPAVGSSLNAISGAFVTMTSLGLTIGFVLYYILPFLPFMYFFFAVGAWVKTIFEAMVGVPLWALAHLRIDGHGLPGEAAMNGYFMIFEIFIRPVLILFGLLGGLIFFSGAARVLHDIFPLLIVNLTGYDSSDLLNATPDDMSSFKGSALDEFFYTIIYTVIIYMMATGSFKLIDQIPSHAMQWMGAGIRTFSDQDRDDPEGRLMQYAAIGTAGMTQKLGASARAGAELGGTVLGGVTRTLTGKLSDRNVRVTDTAKGGKGGKNASKADETDDT